MPRTGSLRWWIVGLLFVATIINYVDRQSLSILATTIQHAIHMSDIAYGYVITAFLLAYTIAYAVAGPVTDRVGVRWSMALFIVVWSSAELIPPFVHSASLLGASRFVLGIGEAGIWVVGPKAIGELFASTERAFALGIYTSGAMLGATIAPPLIATLSIRHGWGSVFLVTGVAGMLWVAPWLFFSRTMGRAPQAIPRAPGARAWTAMLQNRNLWILMLVRMVTDPVWYFYLFWYPKYLGDARHLSLRTIGHSVWLVYLCADIGSIAGGWFSGRLIRRGVEVLRSRQAVMTCAAVLLPIGMLTIFVSPLPVVLTIASLVAFAQMAWLISLTAIIVDLFDGPVVGTAFGFIAAGSGIGGLLSTQLVAHSVANAGYSATFIVMGLLHPLALIAIWLLRPGTSSSTSLSPLVQPD